MLILTCSVSKSGTQGLEAPKTEVENLKTSGVGPKYINKDVMENVVILIKMQWEEILLPFIGLPFW